MSRALTKKVGLFGAVFLGLGSIVGTGVFVGISQTANIVGVSILPAVIIAGALAICNGLSSAQLAGAHPVSGGTYEYGYQFISPLFGYVAGCTFLLAKSASAATAALGASSYLLSSTGVVDGGAVRIGALVLVLVLGCAVTQGIRRTTTINVLLVTVTFTALIALIVYGIGRYWRSDFLPHSFGTKESLFEGAALMFVAFTGYGRIATLGEEIENPKRNIPIAIAVTLLIAVVLYFLVAWLVVYSGAAGAPLTSIAENYLGAAGTKVVMVGALTAMVGVLLNLILGLSRVALAMGRRSDIPSYFSELSNEDSPDRSIWLMTVVVGLFVSVGDMGLTWSFSAHSVLIYYSITNLAALRLEKVDRQFPRIVSFLGLFGCLGLSVFIDRYVALASAFFIALALLIRGIRNAQS